MSPVPYNCWAVGLRTDRRIDWLWLSDDGRGTACTHGWSVAVFNLDAGGDLCYFRSRFNITTIMSRLHTVRVSRWKSPM